MITSTKIRFGSPRRSMILMLGSILLFAGIACAGGGNITLSPANSIQAAINSGLYSEIVLSPGTYNQTIQLDSGDAPLTIRSQDPSDAGNVAATILDGEFLGQPVIRLTSGGADIVIDGLTIQNGEALGGTSNRGGAIDCEIASPTIRRCVLKNSEGSVVGGAFYVNSGNMTVEDTRFEGNTAPQGGAVYINASTVNFVRCVFETNTCGVEGGAIAAHVSTFNLTECRFIENEAGQFGGAIVTRSSSLMTASRCLFYNNYSGGTPGNGRGGAIYHDGADSSSLDNSVFQANVVSNFGASIYTLQNLTLRNTTHYGEISTLGSGDVIDVAAGGRLDMYNSIMWNVMAGSTIAGGGVKNVTYCNIQGGYAGAGNIGADSGDAPAFADAANGDFHLLAGSAGIDAGDATKVLGEYPTDYDGQTRALNDPETLDSGVAVVGISVDMGAFEFQPDTSGNINCPADLNNDTIVNVTDLFGLLAAWGACD